MGKVLWKENFPSIKTQTTDTMDPCMNVQTKECLCLIMYSIVDVSSHTLLRRIDRVDVLNEM